MLMINFFVCSSYILMSCSGVSARAGGGSNCRSASWGNLECSGVKVCGLERFTSRAYRFFTSHFNHIHHFGTKISHSNHIDFRIVDTVDPFTWLTAPDRPQDGSLV